MRSHRVHTALTLNRRTERIAALELKHIGLIVSAGAGVALRFFSDFSLATIQHQAALAGLKLGPFSLSGLGALSLNSISYQLQRDWFNLSPQAPAEIIGLVVSLVCAYIVLRQALAPGPAAAAVLLAIPLVPLVVTVSACAWVLVRASA